VVDSSVTRVPHEKVYGIAAARAVLATRPGDILRIAHTEEVRGAVAGLLREAAARRVPYEERSADDVAKIAGSVHHEGVCLAARPRPLFDLEWLLDRLAQGRMRSVIALDDVGNPHNVGAIVRTAAYFGVASVLVQTEGGRPLPASALRIAEGGSEHVCVTVGSSLPRALAELRRAGFQIVGTDVRGGEPLGAHSFGDRTVIVLGNERSGLSEDVHRLCDDIVMIPGADNLDSLNVSVAAGILAYELHMQLSASTL
jgi:TrmH RNA methyltransferase